MGKWGEAFARAREVARARKQRGVPSTAYEQIGGRPTIRGWQVDCYIGSVEHVSTNGVVGEFTETWGDRELILGVNGSLYELVRTKTQYGPKMAGGARTEETVYLYKITPDFRIRFGEIVDRDTAGTILAGLQKMH